MIGAAEGICGARRTISLGCQLNVRPHRVRTARGRLVMNKALVFGAAALAFSTGAASAQAVFPSHDGNAATAPLYDYAGPASGTPVRAADLHTTTLHPDSCFPSAAGRAGLLHSEV